ncbi:hypothetical protein EU527_16715 [Candidatus Thorarchaeota archaeon]|nr:MAG: hypothetical protein EU527_16715 [Candidatus Thorarchaeota archaeon]
MNEYAILVKLLTRTGNPIGASVEDMLDSLRFPEDTGRHLLFQRLSSLHEKIRPLGLCVKHNPVGGVFYIDTTYEIDLAQDTTALPDKLAATLLIVITLAYQEGGWVSIERVREFRKKALRGIMEDLRDLQEQRYVEISQDKKQVRLGTRVPFEIDYEAFFNDLAEN